MLYILLRVMEPHALWQAGLRGIPVDQENDFAKTVIWLNPAGSPSRNSRRPEPNPGLRGGLEIVFNQQ
ncbi:hypothetical protein VNO77_44471 [Canavalia gladiata]|uniref:Uncharacterized protein n=1 Tax=Canavalia gladiata TaxID=3824 RepID=A0AAN9JY81_CANGL